MFTPRAPRRCGRGRRLRGARQSARVGGRLVDVAGVHDRYDEIFLPLHGSVQAHNAAVAVAAVESFFDRALGVDLVRDGLAWSPGGPGRGGVTSRWSCSTGPQPRRVGALGATLDEEFSTVVLGWSCSACSPVVIPTPRSPRCARCGPTWSCARRRARGRALEPAVLARRASGRSGRAGRAVADRGGAPGGRSGPGGGTWWSSPGASA